jgi:prephenate dehydrogenase
MSKTKETATIEILLGLEKEIDILLSTRIASETSNVRVDIIHKAKTALHETIEYWIENVSEICETVE